MMENKKTVVTTDPKEDKMINIAVLEDDERDREKLKECLRYVEEKERLKFDVSYYSNAMEFFIDINKRFDIVFFDIEMPQVNGLEAAREFRKMNTSAVIVFITNMAQYAVRGYEVEATDFIVKPLQMFDFSLKMSRIIAKTVKQMEKSISVVSDGDVYILPIVDIYYVEVQVHYLNYHTANGNYMEYLTLKECEKKIGNNSFVRCNRCYLVNLRYVRSIQKDIAVVGKDSLVISRPQKKAFLAALSDFISGVLS